MYKLSVVPEDARDEAEHVEREFHDGNCVAVKEKPLSPLGVMQTLNTLGRKHGIGRVDMVENRFVGMKSRGVMKHRAARSSISRIGKWNRSPWIAR